MQCSDFLDIFKNTSPKKTSFVSYSKGEKAAKAVNSPHFLSRAGAFLTARTAMWRVGELLHTALSPFRELRKLAEDVAGSHTGSDSFFLFHFAERKKKKKTNPHSRGRKLTRC